MKENDDGIDSPWFLAKTELEKDVTEFEFILWRLYYSFTKWQEDCKNSISDADIGADDIAIVHLIRMRDRPKTVYEVARLMNRDDMPNLQYSLRKLLKLKLIKKYQQKNKKASIYEISEKGVEFTDRYSEARSNFLIKLFENKNLEWKVAYSVMLECKNMYDEASRVAAISK